MSDFISGWFSYIIIISLGFSMWTRSMAFYVVWKNLDLSSHVFFTPVTQASWIEKWNTMRGIFSSSSSMSTCLRFILHPRFIFGHPQNFSCYFCPSAYRDIRKASLLLLSFVTFGFMESKRKQQVGPTVPESCLSNSCPCISLSLIFTT